MVVGVLVCLWLWGTLGAIVSAVTKALRDLRSRKRVAIDIPVQDSTPRDDAPLTLSRGRRDQPLRRRSCTFVQHYPYFTLNPLPIQLTGGEQIDRSN